MAFDANKYNADYKKANYDSILVRVPKGTREVIQQDAADAGMSVTQYILAALKSYKEGNR